MKRVAACLAASLTCGCLSTATLIRQHEPATQLEAGAVTITASAPMRWEELVTDLRPEFNSASAADRLDDVLPITGYDYASRRAALSIEGGVSVTDEITNITRERTESRDISNNNVTGTDRQTTNTGRTAPSAPSHDATLAAPATGGFDTPALSLPSVSGDIATNPVLRAQAAVALHQELVLLDHYLDEAFDSCLYEAWLVRTRLVVMPYARNQPFDVYTRIYLSRDMGAGFNTNGLRIIPLLVTDNFERSDTRRYEQLISQMQANMSGLSSILALGLGFNSYINNMNALLGSQYNNVLTISQTNDYTLSVRLGAVFSPTSRYEMQARSYDLTFLVLMDRSSIYEERQRQMEERRRQEEELQRQAAERRAQQPPGADGAPEAPTYEQPVISSAEARRALGVIRLGFFANSEFRNAESGAVLPPVPNTSDEDGSWDALMTRLERYLVHSGRADWQTQFEDLRDLPNRAPNTVWDAIDALNSKVYLPEDIYAELSRWALTMYGSYTSLDLSPRRLMLPQQQIGTYTDSLDGGVWARVSGAQGVRDRDLTARLYIAGSSDPRLSHPAFRAEEYDQFAYSFSRAADRPVNVAGPFVADEVRVTASGDVEAAFPSLGALGINAEDGSLYLMLSTGAGRRECPPSSSISYDWDSATAYALLRNRVGSPLAPAGAPTFEARAIAGALTPGGEHNTATLRVAISPLEGRRNPYVANYAISVAMDAATLSGAARLGDDGAPTSDVPVRPASNSARVPAGEGVYNLSFTNLKPSSTLAVTVTALGADGAPIPAEARSFNVNVLARQ